MRYRRYQTSIAKIFDGTITDRDDIHNILTVIKQRELNCKIRLSEGPLQERVRVVQVNEKSFLWKMIKNKSILQQESLFEDIVELEVNTEADLGIQLKPKPSRWTLLDPMSDIDCGV